MFKYLRRGRYGRRDTKQQQQQQQKKEKKVDVERIIAVMSTILTVAV